VSQAHLHPFSVWSSDLKPSVVEYKPTFVLFRLSLFVTVYEEKRAAWEQLKWITDEIRGRSGDGIKCC
jgi:hypothetical protein